MTPEERAQSVLHFLDEYLECRERSRLHFFNKEHYSAKAESARQFLGTALVALVTEAPRIEQAKYWHSGDPVMPGGSTDTRRKVDE